MRYLGIDYGTKKAGLALSDEAGTMGFPQEVVPIHALKQRVQRLVHEKQVGAVVIGESKDFEGNDNAVADEARALGAWISDTLKLPVYFEPEMLTSAQARRARDASVEGRSPKNTDDVDASAAALILTSYLSRHDRT